MAVKGDELTQADIAALRELAAGKAPRRARRERKERWEEIRVLGLDKKGKARAWRDSLPLTVLMENLGEECRYAPETWLPKVLGALAGGLVLGALACGALLPVNSIIAGMVGIMAMFIGGFAGWLIGPRFGPKPFWMVRYRWENDRKVIYPYVHSRLNEDGVAVVDLGEDQDPQVVGVHRAANWFDRELMRDEAEDLTPEKTTQQIIQTASLAIIAVALLVFLFLFIAVMNGAEFQGGGNQAPFDGEAFGRAERTVGEQ
jgi:hypothetical protein